MAQDTSSINPGSFFPDARSSRVSEQKNKAEANNQSNSDIIAHSETIWKGTYFRKQGI